MANPRKRKAFDRSDLISVLAVILSMGAFAVSLYEASILKQQQQIMFVEQEMMRSQQKASVWPYLEADISYQYANEKFTLQYDIRNKGVGPAKIVKADLIFTDSILSDYNSMTALLLSKLPKKEDQLFQDDLQYSMNFSMAQPSGVLSTGEAITWLLIEFPRFKGDMEFWRDNEFKYVIQYASIYDDCWELRSGSPNPVELAQCISETQND